MTQGFRMPGLVVLHLVMAAARADVAIEPALDLAASTPVARLTPRPGGRFIRLPELAFEFSVRPSCPADLQPHSVTLSIADTRESIDAGQFSDATTVSVTLHVPAIQLAPVAADDFCRLTDDIAKANVISVHEITIPAAVTAHASLRCAGQNRQTMTYVTKALDVTVLCENEISSSSATGGD